MLEPIGLIAMLDRLGRASRAQSTRCVYGLILWYRYRVHLYITSSRATIQARVRKLRGFCGQRPALEAARGNPPPPPGPPGKRRQSKAALRGREGSRASLIFSRATHTIVPFSLHANKVHRKAGSLETARTHTLALKRSYVMVWRQSLRFAQCRDHDGGQSPTRRHAHV
jgi:hypothetical protein